MKQETIKYRLSESAELSAIKRLLESADLPASDIDARTILFLVATGERNPLIGCIGIEQIGEDALLRSFAVDPLYRGQQIGRGLVDRLLSVSRQLGVARLHLLTTTAETYFTRIGFLQRPRTEAPPSIRETSEFSSLCPSSSVYMVMEGVRNRATCFFGDVAIATRDEESGSVYHAVSGDSIIIPAGQTHRVWTENHSARALDGWSPVNNKFSKINN